MHGISGADVAPLKRSSDVHTAARGAAVRLVCKCCWADVCAEPRWYNSYHQVYDSNPVDHAKQSHSFSTNHFCMCKTK